MAKKIADDNTIFDYGKYKGTNTRLIDVPAHYLIWLWHSGYSIPSEYYDYIKDNYEALKKGK